LHSTFSSVAFSAAKAKILGDFRDWFVTHSKGDEIPSARAIRRHVGDPWLMLRKLEQDENA